MKTIIEITNKNRDLLDEVLTSTAPKGFDTETTGKEYTDTPFVLTVASGETVYYVDLSEGFTKFPKAKGKLYSHNAKFDLLMLKKTEEFSDVFNGDVHCTAVGERLLRNDRMPKDYGLGPTAKRYGYEKDSSVDEYIRAHGLYEVRPTGKSPQFHKVPKEIMKQYAGQDAWLHLQIGLKQSEKLN